MPSKITARGVIITVASAVGFSGAVYALGYVIDTAFRDLLGVDRVSYLTTIDLGLNVARMVMDIAGAIGRTFMAHPVIATTASVLVVGGSIYAIRGIVKHQPSMGQSFLYALVAVLAITTALKVTYFTLPYTQYENLLQSRVRVDRTFAAPTVLADRTKTLWQALVCAHSDVEGCTGSTLTHQRTLDIDYSRNVLVSLILIACAALLYNRQRSRTQGKSTAHEFAHLVVLVLLVWDALALAYVYGKAIRTYEFDRIQWTRSSTPLEYGTGLLLSENDKMMIVYDEAEGLIDETAVATKKLLGRTDLLRTYIEYSNRPQEK